jgi:hypothetical protein
VVVPARNEGLHIEACLDSLLRQSTPAEDYEIIVVDGNSTDNTCSLVRNFASRRSNLKLIENWTGTTPSGMNLGIRRAKGDVIIIAGAHSVYPEHLVAKSLEYLEQTGAAVVGGPIVSVPTGNGLASRLIATITSSRFGVGSSFRTANKAGFVETVPFGAYRREVLERVGLYNESLLRNQDNDLSARIRQAGGRIYLTPELTVCYRTTGSLLRLLQKTFKDSTWHAFTVRENPGAMSPRHFAPLALLLIMLLAGIFSLFSPSATRIAAAVLVMHIGIGLGYGLGRAKDLGLVGILAFPFTCLAFHLTYGIGTLAGFLKLMLNWGIRDRT